jgi:uncharacterized membrane-anchored protein YitT (DUF2179 family)
MRSFNFPGSISIGSRAHTNKIVETTINILCPCIELPKVILAIRKFDEQCAISSYICAIDGEINIERSFV